MNKKIKLSLISSLVTVSSIGIILPIASCSSSSNSISIYQSTDENLKEALGLAIAKIANPNATNTNGYINQNQFKEITTREYTSIDKEVWTALGNFFTFDSGLSFNDVIKNVVVTGQIENIGSDAKVKVVLNLKSGYFVSDINKLTLSNLNVGVFALNITQSNDPKSKEEMALALAKIGNPNATNINDNLNLNQFRKITSINYTSINTTIWTALGNFFTFDYGYSFSDVVESAFVNGTFGNACSEIKVKIVLKLKKNYFVSDNSKLTSDDLKIGLAINMPLNVTQSNDASVKEALGLAIAKIANPNATNTNGYINQDQFNLILNNYDSGNQDIWNPLSNFFILDSGINFTVAINKVSIIKGNFSGVANDEIKIKLVLVVNNGYLVSNANSLILNDLKIGLVKI